MAKRLWLVLAAVLVLSMGAYAQDQVRLVVYCGSTTGSPGDEVCNDWLDRYMELNPHVTIENRGREHNPDFLTTLFLAGEAPDIIEHGADVIRNFYLQGFLEPVPAALQRRIEQEAFPISAHSVTLDGVMFGVPVESISTGLMYNRRAMDDHGIADPPQTIEELEWLARRTARVDGQGRLLRAGLAHSGDAVWALDHMGIAMLHAEGGRIVDENGRVVLDGAPVRRTLDRLTRWIGDGDFFGFDWGQYEAFNRGEVPFAFAYSWWLNAIRPNYEFDYAADFGVVKFPGTEGFGALHYGHAYGVNASSPHIDEAYKLLEWLTLAEVEGFTPHARYHWAIGSMPIIQRDVSMPDYHAEFPIWNGFTENMAHGANTEEWERYGAMGANIGTQVLRIVNREVSPVGAIEDMLRQIETNMAEHQRFLAELRR